MAHRRLAQLLLALTILVISCDFSSVLPLPLAAPTTIPGLVNTIVASTADVAMTRTAALILPTLTASATSTSTRIPTDTPTFTPTFVLILPSATRTPTATPITTGTSTSGMTCTVVSQAPADNTHLPANKGFAASWKVKNTGSSAWDPATVDFAYLSGTKMYKSIRHDLPVIVAPGEKIDLTAGMTAPKNDGTYNTVWSLRQGNNSFCRVALQIIVP
jgi:hypothetical protein